MNCPLAATVNRFKYKLKRFEMIIIDSRIDMCISSNEIDESIEASKDNRPELKIPQNCNGSLAKMFLRTRSSHFVTCFQLAVSYYRRENTMMDRRYMFVRDRSTNNGSWLIKKNSARRFAEIFPCPAISQTTMRLMEIYYASPLSCPLVHSKYVGS